MSSGVGEAGGVWATRVRAAVLIGAAMALTAIGTGCRLVQSETLQTKSMLQSLVGARHEAAGTNALEVLQSEVMRNADIFVAAVARATDDFRVRVPTPAARLAALQWKLIEATSAYVNATGENPVLDAVDMAVLATLSRFVIEDIWVGRTFGEAARPLLETHVLLEAEAWKVLHPYLSPDQVRDLHSVLDDYRRRFPDSPFIATVRLPELAAALGRHSSAPGSPQRAASIFNLLYLDPLAGLDPAMQAVEQTRLLALRAMYYAQRAPMLLSWQVELTTYQLAAQPESQQVLGDLNGVSGSAQSLARTAELLPGLIHTEREEALNQFFIGVARERTNLLMDLASQEAALQRLLPQVRETLNAGQGAASSVREAIASLDGFVRMTTTPDTHSPPATSGPPFDVRDYGKAAEKIGVAARELNATLKSLDRTVPGLERLGDQATADAKAVVTHAFRLALILVLVAGVVAVVAVRICRRSGAAGSTAVP